MLMAMRKKLLWMVVVWFAMLQTVTPFIHAHMEADSPAQGHGLHVHAPALPQAFDNQHRHVLSEHPAHTVGVNAAVVEDADPLPLPLFILLFVLSLPAIAVRQAAFSFIQFPFSQLLLRSISRPRAPPQL